jgi:hypothetical protein
MEQLFFEVLEAAKSLAKSYSHHPSLASAEEVDAAWRRIVVLHGISRLRRLAGHEGQRALVISGQVSQGPAFGGP